MNWILLKSEEVVGGRACLTEARATHINQVLRAAKGQKLRVGLLNGPVGCATILELNADHVLLDCQFETQLPPRPQIDLLLAMPRPKVLKRLWSQFAALGVGRIMITNAEKVERCYFDTHILTPEFYMPLLVEGLQQAGDTLLPEVKIIRNLSRFLDENPFAVVEKKLIADPSGTQSIFECLQFTRTNPRQPERQGGRVLLGIGPEGGWTRDELQRFDEEGFMRFGLGSRILRTDTACIALVGIVAEIQRAI